MEHTPLYILIRGLVRMVFWVPIFMAVLWGLFYLTTLPLWVSLGPLALTLLVLRLRG